MQTLRENVIEVLLKSKQLTKEQLEDALKIQKQKNLPLRRVLIEQGYMSEEALLSLLSAQLYIPTLHLTKYKFDADILRLIPERVARQYKIIPLSRIGGTLTVAMADPLDIFALDDLKAITGCAVDTVLSPEEEILRAVEGNYHAAFKNME